MKIAKIKKKEHGKNESMKRSAPFVNVHAMHAIHMRITQFACSSLKINMMQFTHAALFFPPWWMVDFRFRHALVWFGLIWFNLVVVEETWYRTCVGTNHDDKNKQKETLLKLCH